MKLLFVVQRYGSDVLGGAEQHARYYAERLAARGHSVEVVSSCAHGYLDWSNHYPAGMDLVNGIKVHRLPVARERDLDLFGRLSSRVLPNAQRVPYHLQKEWMRLQGPLLLDLPEWLSVNSSRFDACTFVTYLYYTTWAGIAASKVPAILIPTAHDEPALRLGLFDGVFQLADGFAFNTLEEANLVTRRFRLRRPMEITGLGIDEPKETDDDLFRRRFGLGSSPYVVYAGRIDISKGAVELFDYFTRYKSKRPGPLKLVLVGAELTRLPDHPDVIKTGYVDDTTRDSALHGAELLIQPSYFESFSMVLMEAWSLGTPALVQGRCEVLVGQCMRSSAGIPYWDFADFGEKLDLLLGDRELRIRMAVRGREAVKRLYRWDAVLGRFERLVKRLTTGAVFDPHPPNPVRAGSI